MIFHCINLFEKLTLDVEINEECENYDEQSEDSLDLDELNLDENSDMSQQ